MQFEKLLVTTDLSDESGCALDAAADLARGFGSSILLLTVIDFDADLPPGVLTLSRDKVQRLKQEVTAKVGARLEAMAAGHFAGLDRVQTRVEVGNGTASMICDVAQREKADLLVISTHGRTGLRRALIGSVAERVVRTAPCPVLSVRPALPAA